MRKEIYRGSLVMQKKKKIKKGNQKGRTKERML